MNFDISEKHLSELKSLGYCKIENFLNEDQLKEINDSWNNIKGEAIKEKIYSQHKQHKTTISSNIYKKDGKWNLWKSHYILIRTEIGKKYIKGMETLMHKINPDLIFFKDKIMNQGPETKGHRPHQDTSSGDYGFYEKFTTGELYTMYISLTDTNIDNGCLWLEDIKERRSNRLGFCDEGCVGGNPCLCTNWEYTSENIRFYNGHVMKSIPQKSGDAVIFDGYALHGTGKNITNDTRKTMLIMYAVPKEEYQYIDKEKYWEFARKSEY